MSLLWRAISRRAERINLVTTFIERARALAMSDWIRTGKHRAFRESCFRRMDWQGRFVIEREAIEEEAETVAFHGPRATARMRHRAISIGSRQTYLDA